MAHQQVRLTGKYEPLRVSDDFVFVKQRVIAQLGR